MRHIVIMLMAVAVCCGLPDSGPAGAPSDLVETINGGGVNWTGGIAYIQVSPGVGVPPYDPAGDDTPGPMDASVTADVASRLLTQKFTAVVRAIRIDQTRHVADILDHDSQRAARVAEVLHRCSSRSEYLTTRGLPGRFCPIYGDLADLLLPEDIQLIDNITAMPANGRPATANAHDAQGYTGLIVDARGFSVTPMLMPVVRDESGREVYGPAFISREYARKRGMVQYIRDMEVARASTRTGAQPLIVKALVLENPPETDLIVSSADAARVRSNFEHLLFMKQGRVIIVTD